MQAPGAGKQNAAKLNGEFILKQNGLHSPLFSYLHTHEQEEMRSNGLFSIWTPRPVSDVTEQGTPVTKFSCLLRY